MPTVAHEVTFLAVHCPFIFAIPRAAEFEARPHIAQPNPPWHGA